ncbi:MAG: futalosine hydrolase [Deinococcales bacterium]
MQASLLLLSATVQEARAGVDALQGGALACDWGQAWHARVSTSDVVLLAAGVGKVNTAAGLALALERWQPPAVIQFGIGGAYLGSFLSNGMAAVAASELHIDCGAGEGAAWQDLRALGLPLLAGPPALFNQIPTDPGLSRALADAAGLPVVPFATSERVTADFDESERLQSAFDVAIESMEGAAAAQVCAARGVPFAEVRAVSNVVGERNRAAWDVPGAIRCIGRVLETALPVLAVGS